MSFFHLLALTLGVALCLQGAANGLLRGRIGLPLTLSINSGLVFAGSLAWLLVSRLNAAPVERASAPWPYYTGGLSGLVILSCAALTFPQLGASTTTVLAVAAQLATALLLDRFGLAGQQVPLGAARVLGLALVAAGVALALGVGGVAEG